MLAFALLFLIEIGLFLLAPRVLARLAFLPIALDRRIPLDDELARALTRELDGGDYRRPPARVLEPARLERALGAGLVGFVDADATFAGGAVWVRVARFGRYWVGRPFLVARIRPRLEGGSIALRVRVLPVPLFSVGALALVALGPPLDWRAALLATLAVIVMATGSALWNRALVRSVVSEASIQLASRALPASSEEQEP